MPKAILITIDVEDWFQVENFKAWIPFETWARRELRVERNVHRLLELFDSIAVAPIDSTTRNPKPETLNPRIRATFFILGWLAKRLPAMVREIRRHGHEVASHGFHHDLPQKLDPAALRQDLEKSKKLLEDILGQAVTGYRAPSFAVDRALLDTLAAAGYRYDSSYNSFALHGRYGKMTLPAGGTNSVARRLHNGILELPVSNLRVGGRVIPWAGGGYFRLMPTGLFIEGVRSILQRDNAYVFYMHPWEVDPGQPRVAQASRWFKFRHYVHLDRTAAKLRRLIESFSHCEFTTCRDYLFGGRQG